MKKGINSFQLKWFGIIFMTLDHIGQYISFNIGTHPFRIVGRIAAPLFLYVTVNSIYYTRNKLKYMFRLYIAHILICMTTLFLTTVGRNVFGVHDQFSILSTYTYVVLFIWIIEKLNKSTKKAVTRNFLYLIITIGIIVIPIVIMFLFSQFEIVYQIFLPNILIVPYSPLFILMGIWWYFVKDKKRQILVLVIFSCLSLIGAQLVNRSGIWLFRDFFNINQFWTILFFPFICLYNGKKGKTMKYFFYMYYPLHIFVLMLLGQFINAH